MKYFSKISCFLIVLSVMSLVGTMSSAQDVMKIDSGKTGGKFADWAQKQQENYQNTVEQISESQFATFVGDGIKAAKSGIKFAKDTYKGAMDVYNETKDSVLNSTEYKAAMISKQIAEESKSLKDLQEQKEAKLAALKADAELERVTLEEKAKQAQKNLNVSIEVYQTELQNATSEVEKARIESEIASFKQGSSVELVSFESETKQIESNLKAETKQIEIEFGEEIYNQGEKVADLTLQLKDLLAEDKKDKGTAETDPDKVIAEAMDDLSFKEGEAVSLQDRKNKQKKRQSKLKSTMMKAMGGAVTSVASTDDTSEEQENVAETSETVNGKSETVQFAVQSTVNQLDGLQQYLLMELKAIEAEAVIILSQEEYKAGKANASIDICDYSGEKGGLMGMVDQAKSTAGKVQSGISQAKGAVNQVTSTVNEAKGAIDEAKGAVGEATSAVGDISSLAGMK